MEVRANLVLNRLMQLLMQIQCNHSHKQTEHELLRTNRKDKSIEQYWIQFIEFKKQKINPYYFLVRIYSKSGTPTGIRTPVAAVKGQCPRPLDDGRVTEARHYTEN